MMSLSQDDYSRSRIVKQENIGQYFISTVRLPEAYKFGESWTLGKYETMILHQKSIYVKVVKNHLRDLEFSSSERRRKRGPKAPKRILV